MAATTRGRSKSAAVNKDLINSAGNFLETLPEKPKEEMSLREAMKYLKEPIQAALAKGYNYPDLADLLGQQGINISATTLKNYVPTGKRQAAKEKKAAAAGTKSKRGRKPKASSEDALEADLDLAETDTYEQDQAMQSNGATPDEAAPAGRSTRGRKPGATTKSSTPTRAKTSTRAKSSTTAATRSTRGRKKTAG